MAIIQKKYLFYESTAVVDGKNFYTFRVVLMDDTDRTLYHLLGDDQPQAIQLIDIPLLIPSMIAEDTLFSIYGGSGTWQAPEDMYFIYAKGAPFSEGVYPTSPDEEDVIVSTTFWNRPQVVFCSHEVGDISEWPTGDDPSGKDVESGWAFPDYEDFGYQEHGMATRYLSPFYYTVVEIDVLWAWYGCSDYDEDEDHFLNNIPSDTLPGNILLQWSTPFYIYNCHEEDSGFTFWIERDILGGGSVEHLSIWLFEADNPAYYYPHLVEINPGVLPVGVLVALLAIALLLPALVDNKISFIKKFPRLYAKPERRGLQTDGKGLQTDGKGLQTQAY